VCYVCYRGVRRRQPRRSPLRKELKNALIAAAVLYFNTPIVAAEKIKTSRRRQSPVFSKTFFGGKAF